MAPPGNHLRIQRASCREQPLEGAELPFVAPGAPFGPVGSPGPGKEARIDPCAPMAFPRNLEETMSLPHCSRLTLLGFALVPCLSLSAAGPVHYGFSAHVNFPMADLHKDLNGKVGAGGSFQVSIETSDRTIIRPRLDLDTFPVSERDRANDPDIRDRVDLGSVGIGADFLYSFGGRNDHGCYALGGLGVQRWIQTFSHRNS